MELEAPDGLLPIPTMQVRADMRYRNPAKLLYDPAKYALRLLQIYGERLPFGYPEEI
jgi:hypothetical protein